MSKKDLNEKMVKEPLTQAVGDKGRVQTHRVLRKPTEDEDWQAITAGLGQAAQPTATDGTGFANYQPNTPSQASKTPLHNEKKNTGFASWSAGQGGLQDEDVPDLQDDDALTITNALASNRKLVAAAIQSEITRIENTYAELPPDWRNMEGVREAVIQTIAENLELLPEEIVSYI